MKNLAVRTTLLSALAVVASANYDPAIGLRTMYYSAASYCAKQTLDPWNCGEPCSVNSGLTSITFVENELLDTFGFVAFNGAENEIVVSFRGTNGADFMNWITNMVYYRV
jgi:hypothetical protein